jgi:hypothetical protein
LTMSRKAKKQDALGQPKSNPLCNPSSPADIHAPQMRGGARLDNRRGGRPPLAASDLNAHSPDLSSLDLGRDELDWRYSL